jgi:Holliday junction DNA helicase RuvA
MGDAVPLAGADQEAMSALEALGYKPVEAQRMVKAVPDAEALPVEQIIRLALKPLASKA